MTDQDRRQLLAMLRDQYKAIKEADGRPCYTIEELDELALRAGLFTPQVMKELEDKLRREMIRDLEQADRNSEGDRNSVNIITHEDGEKIQKYYQFSLLEEFELWEPVKAHFRKRVIHAARDYQKVCERETKLTGRINQGIFDFLLVELDLGAEV